MTSLHVICALGPPNQKSWLRLCSERWVFNEEMRRTVFFAEANNGIASCLMSNQTVAILKECSLRRRHDTKHLLKYPNYPAWGISVSSMAERNCALIIL